MSDRNAPLTPQGRLRLVLRCQHRPIAHIAAEAGVSRQCLSKWVHRYRLQGQAGLADRPSTPHHQPGAIDRQIVARIEQLRRDRKWSARLIAVELTRLGDPIATRTVGRWLERLGLNQRRLRDTDGTPLRTPGKITARFPGHVHLDVKKVGRIPQGGGWRTHGRGSAQDKAAGRAKTAGAKAGFGYLHSAVDGYSRLAYTEPLPDETAATTVAFLRRARGWFADHGIDRIVRIITDNGANYRSTLFAAIADRIASRHQRTRPYTPRHNGKVERYQRILAEELLYPRPFTSEQQRASAIAVWNVHYNYHRPHTAAGDQPPATRLHTRVTNVQPSYT